MAVPVRNLVVVLGDQLQEGSAAFDGADPSRDVVWMAETAEEATYVWSHKIRLVLFFSAMRHLAAAIRKGGFSVRYHALTANPEDDAGFGLSDILSKDLATLGPERIVMVQPGDARVLEGFRKVGLTSGVPLDIREDRHFLCRFEEFRDFALEYRSFRMEHFYRRMRRALNVLLDDTGKPFGGKWNYDAANRKPFGSEGPGSLPALPSFAPDGMTREVMHLVAKRFPDHPGSTEAFDLPVTRSQARTLLDHFIEYRLPFFGPYQDAMWPGESTLYHSRLSTSLNLKLLSPMECIAPAVKALRLGKAPLQSVEGFIRQVLGWREYVRGIYWLYMPEYQERNVLEHDAPLPRFYWNGLTEMVCFRETMTHVLREAYSHHIHRLMIAGLLAQLLGVRPYAFHEWHMAMYADAVDWVSLPNTLGMSQYADGGTVGSKPYCATGRYIQRQSPFCRTCLYDPSEAAGDRACPFTALYWHFLYRHRKLLEKNPRMGFQIRHLKQKMNDPHSFGDILRTAESYREKWLG